MEARVSMFMREEWAKLVEMSLFASNDAAKKNSRARRRDQDTIEKRARRALRMVHLGEVSAGTQSPGRSSARPRRQHHVESTP